MAWPIHRVTGVALLPPCFAQARSRHSRQAGLLTTPAPPLFMQVRSRDGLAYSVSAGWDTPLDHRGTFTTAAQTSRPGPLLIALRGVLTPPPPSAAAAGDAVGDAASLDLSSSLDPDLSQWPRPAAVRAAKDRFLNAFVFNFASKSQQLQRLLSIELLGLPRCELDGAPGLCRSRQIQGTAIAEAAVHPAARLAQVRNGWGTGSV